MANADNHEMLTETMSQVVKQLGLEDGDHLECQVQNAQLTVLVESDKREHHMSTYVSQAKDEKNMQEWAVKLFKMHKSTVLLVPASIRRWLGLNNKQEMILWTNASMIMAKTLKPDIHGPLYRRHRIRKLNFVGHNMRLVIPTPFLDKFNLTSRDTVSIRLIKTGDETVLAIQPINYRPHTTWSEPDNEILQRTPFTSADSDAAWALYVEMTTRIVTNYLPDESGDEQSALDSVYSLFQITRDILHKYGRDASQFSKVAIHMLNQTVRPFTAKWHKESMSGAFIDKTKCKKFRSDLAMLSDSLLNYRDTMAEIAGVSDADSQENTITLQHNEKSDKPGNVEYTLTTRWKARLSVTHDNVTFKLPPGITKLLELTDGQQMTVCTNGDTILISPEHQSRLKSLHMCQTENLKNVHGCLLMKIPLHIVNRFKFATEDVVKMEIRTQYGETVVMVQSCTDSETHLK